MKSLLRFVLAAAVAVPLAFSAAPRAMAADDIVDTAVKAGAFNTLVTAVKAAGLVDTLKSKGPFTVFAPTDAAFAKLPTGTLEMLLKPENKATLAKILTYHVLPGTYSSERLMKAKAKVYTVKTAAGEPVTFRKGTVGLTIDGANISKVDIAASNGTIHVIEQVILPASVKKSMAKGAGKQAAVKKH